MRHRDRGARQTYPRPLPAELAAWYVYIENLGHCIAVAVDGWYKLDGDPLEYMALAPVRVLQEAETKIQDGVIVARVPATRGYGVVVEWDDGELEC